MNKDKIVKFRVTKEEKNILNGYAVKAGVSVSRFIRKEIFNPSNQDITFKTER